MPQNIQIGDRSVAISDDGKTVTIEGVALPLEVLLMIAEFAMTGSDLCGSEGEGVDPRYKFVAVMGNLHRVDGYGSGALRFKAPHYLTMFGTGSNAPMRQSPRET